MDLTVLEISKDEATERLAEYEQMITSERTAEDAAIAAGYRAAARGLPVISLQRSIIAGGFHGNSLPKIAVIRADVTECFVRWQNGNLIFSDRDDWYVNRGALVGAHSVRVAVPGDNQPTLAPGDLRRVYSGSTVVPLIPPRHRPRPRRLRGCHILWEVDEWGWIPPRDPALLRHIRGDLWAVLATWDLTDLERAVLAQR